MTALFAAPLRGRYALLRSCAMAMLFLLVSTLAAAQLPEPLDMPDLQVQTHGVVQAFARAADGSIVIGGAFTAVDGVPRRNLARLLPNGALDTAWNAGTNSTVSVIVIDASGDVFVGGSFTEAGGLVRRGLVKVMAGASGTVDPNWNPTLGLGGFGGFARDLALDGEGSIYVGGFFSTAGGLSRNNLAKISTSGSGLVDGNWDPNATGGSVEALALLGGDLFIGGDFLAVGGQTRVRLAKVSATGTGAVDATWDPDANNLVSELEHDGGFIYVGGAFPALGGQSHPGLGRVSAATGAADGTWNPTAGSGVVLSISIDGTTIYVATGLGLRRASTTDGNTDASFSPTFDGTVNAVAAFGDGLLHVGGQFAHVNDTLRLSYARFDSADALLSSAFAMTGGSIYALEALPDGSTLAGGDFYVVEGLARENLLKLTPTGALDSDWAPATNNTVFGLTRDLTGSAVYLWGEFSMVNGVGRLGVAKVFTSNTGVLDAAWDPSPTADSNSNNLVRTVALGADESVYLGGNFEAVAGTFWLRLAKVSGIDGSLDTTFGSPAGVNNAVSQLAVAPDGSVFASGSFTVINGQTRSRFAKLDPLSGAADAGWSADLTGFDYLRDIVFDGDAMFAGGSFSSIGGVSRSNLAKVSVSNPAVVDPDFAPVFNLSVESMDLDTEGSLFAGGGFTRVNGQIRRSIAKLASADGALDPNWKPDVYGGVNALAINRAGNVVIGGAFQLVGTQTRIALAALPPKTILPDPIFADGFE